MCFTLGWLMSLLVWIVIAVATYVILIKILLPYLLRKLAPSGAVGEGIGILGQVLHVIFWAIIVIIVIYVTFALLACLWSFAGGSLPSLFPHSR